MPRRLPHLDLGARGRSLRATARVGCCRAYGRLGAMLRSQPRQGSASPAAAARLRRAHGGRRRAVAVAVALPAEAAPPPPEAAASTSSSNGNGNGDGKAPSLALAKLPAQPAASPFETAPLAFDENVVVAEQPGGEWGRFRTYGVIAVRSGRVPPSLAARLVAAAAARHPPPSAPPQPRHVSAIAPPHAPVPAPPGSARSRSGVRRRGGCPFTSPTFPADARRRQASCCCSC